jgi:type I restriction enzyme S subunit
MRDGWTTKTLDEVCDFTNGLWKGEKPPFLTVGVIRNTNFTKEGALDDSDIAYIEVEAKKYEKRRLQLGDIILEKSGGGPKQPVGRVVLFDKQDGDFSFSNFTAALRVRDLGEVDFRYLHKFLHWTYLSGVTEGIQSHSTGIRNLNGDAYKAIAFNYPPLPEQQRIVALLDEGFAGLATAKANAERNLQNARAIFESHLQSVFSRRGEGWDELALSEVCDIKHGYAFEGEFFSAEGDYVLLTPGNFYEAGGYRDRGGKQKYFTGEIPRDYVLREGDLLVAMTEQAAGLLGSSLLVPESEKFLHNQRLGLVTAKPDVAWSNEFFFHVFNTQQVRREIHDSASGVKVRHTSPTKIGDVIVSFPLSLREQEGLVAEFASISAETQRLTRLYERKLAALEELKKSLLHQAFNGEL